VSAPNSGAATLILKPSRDLSDPDLLLYWVDHDVSVAADLSDARLLGSVSAGKSFSLPNDKQHGVLILYSLAHMAIVDKANVEGLP
jgi:hypothetical protein